MQEGEEIILLPNHLDLKEFNRPESKGGWMLETGFTEQVVIDHRTARQQLLQRDFKTGTCLKKEMNRWEYRPEIKASEE